MYAAWDNSVEALKVLLEKGAQIEAKDKVECTVLDYASVAGKRDAINFLKQKGASRSPTCKPWATK